MRKRILILLIFSKNKDLVRINLVAMNYLLQRFFNDYTNAQIS